MNRGEEIVHKYILIIKEYLQHMMQSQTLKTIDNSTYIIVIGLNTIIHVFKIMLSTTKDIDKTYIQCQKAYYCYLEYIEQMNKTNFLHNLNNLNAILFVYKKTVAVDLTPILGMERLGGFPLRSGEATPSWASHGTVETIEQTELGKGAFTPPTTNFKGDDMRSPVGTEGSNLEYRRCSEEKFATENTPCPEQGGPKPEWRLMNIFFNTDEHKEIVRSEPEISNTLNLISSATKTILFFTDELYFETEENMKKNLEQISNLGVGRYKEHSPPDQNHTDKTISIEEIIQLVENHLLKILLLCVSSLSVDNINQTSHTTIRSSIQIVFDYINLLQEKLVMDYDTYNEFLLEFYKKIKQLKRANKMPTIYQINTNSMKYFYQEENLQELKKLLETKKYNVFVKNLFTF